MAITTTTLRHIAMAAMLCDHLWATIVPGNAWLTWVGRIAFPIFAYLTAQGYFHTGNFKKYLGRMALFALISELPFNLMYTGLWIFPFHQNVLWSFVLVLLAMKSLDAIKRKLPLWLAVPLRIAVVFAFVLLAQLLMVD